MFSTRFCCAIGAKFNRITNAEAKIKMPILIKQRHLSSVQNYNCKMWLKYSANFSQFRQSRFVFPYVTILETPSRAFGSRGKDRKKEAKGHSDSRPKVILEDEQMEQVLRYGEFREAVETIIEQYKSDLKLNYNLHLNPRQIETLRISFGADGGTPLAEIGAIARKGTTLVINLSAQPEAVKPTLAAIHKSGLNLNPQQDGNIIYVRIEKAITAEARESMAKNVRAAASKAKDQLKNGHFQRRFFHKDNKDGSRKRLSDDLQHDAAANLAYYVKRQCDAIDEIARTKIASLLQTGSDNK